MSTRRDWWHWLLGFLAGSVLASYVALSCGVGHTQSAVVVDAISRAAWRHGVSYEWLRSTAWCESRYRTAARGKAGEMGLFQFKWTTYRWMSQRAGLAGTDPDDPYAAAMVAAWGFRHGYAYLWSCA